MEVLKVIGAFVGMFALAALILMVRDQFFGPRPRSPAERQAAAAAWRARLLAPDWPAVERQLGRPAPQILRTLYANHDLLLSVPLTVRRPGSEEKEWDINSFHPADGRGDHFEIPPRAFCFANNIFGDPYYVTLGVTGEDGPVLVHHHDGGDLEWVAESLAQFLSWPRQTERPHPDADS